MGRSKTIREQQKANAAFNDYVKSMAKDMEEHVDKTSKTLDAMIEAHYKSFPDKAMLQQGQYSHLSTFSQWSLDSVNEILNQCRDALFGKAPAPKGTEQKKPTEEEKNSLTAIKERELYIANAAFEVIQGIIGSFGSITSTSVMAKAESKPLAPGLTLFIGVLNNAYSSSSFFKNEKIVQNIFVYKIWYSIQEGQRQSQLSDLEAYENQKVVFRQKLNQLNGVIMKLDILGSDYLDKMKVYNTLIDATYGQLKAIDQKISELTRAKGLVASAGAEDAAALAECEAIVASARSRWELACADRTNKE